MPNRVAESHRRRFREEGILPEHARYGRATFEGSTGGCCTLCGNTNLTYLYRLTFEIPARDVPIGSEAVRHEAARNVQFFPVGSECIYNWTAYLREAGATDEDVRAWEQGPVAAVMAVERDRAAERARVRRLERINSWFIAPGFMNPYANRISVERRTRWANEFGDVALGHLEQHLTRIADWWNAHGGPGAVRSNRFRSVRFPFNPETMREVGRHGARGLVYACEFCGAPARGTTEDFHAPRGFERERVCALCGVRGHEEEVEENREPRRQPLTMGTAEGALATADQLIERLTHAHGLNEAQREVATRALQMRLPEQAGRTVREIVGNVLRHDSMTDRQMAYLASTFQDDPRAPSCPVHNVRMARRTGPYGEFYSCPNFPNCRVTANLSGAFRNLPQGVRPPTPTQALGEALADAANPRPTPTPEVTRRDNPWSDAPAGTRAGRRADGRPIPAREGVVEEPTATQSEQGKLFKAVLVATFREKCQDQSAGGQSRQP